MPVADMPQSNRQHPVPQNIMDVEFKLIGELTMRQFSYLLVFGLAAYFSSTMIPGVFKWPMVIFFALLAIGLAFIPVQERGLDEWLVNFFRSVTSPTQRTWKKELQLPTAFLYDSLAVVHHELITLAPTSSRRKLEEYLKFKSDDSVDDPLDIPEKEYVMKLREVYYEAPSLGGAVGVAVDEPEISGGYGDVGLGIVVEDQVPVSDAEVPGVVEEIVGETVITDAIAVPATAPVTTAPKQTSATGPQIVDRKEVSAPVKIEKSRAVYSKSDYQSLGGVGRRRSARPAPGPSTMDLDFYSYQSVTPDMHSGRKFTNLVPSDGEIMLPIRGERVLKTSEDEFIESDIEEKARKLEDLLEQIRIEEGIVSEKKVPKTTEKPETPVVDEKAEKVAQRLQKHNEELTEEIEKLKNQIKEGKNMSVETDAQEQLLQKLESQKDDIASSYSELRSQVQELQKKLDERVKVSTGKEFISKIKRQLPVLTDKSNVLTGVVRDIEGKQLSDILLIVKNSRGDTIRALKTNSMGQFIVSTPLQNGTYTVEVSPANKTNLTFAIIPVEVKDGIIPTLDVVGK